MKQKDIAIIVVTGIVAAIFALVLTQIFFVPKNTQERQVEVVDPISADFKTPDNKVFNENAINPTQLIQIGDGNNSTPF